jgi:predicted nucleic acid-binding Zn finger protein
MQLITQKTKVRKPKPNHAPASAYATVAAVVSSEKKKKPSLTRQEKAVALVDSVLKSEQLSSANDSIYFVQSQTNKDKVYEVHLIGHKFGCDCPDFLCRNVEACKHILAVQLVVKKEQQQETSA